MIEHDRQQKSASQAHKNKQGPENRQILEPDDLNSLTFGHYAAIVNRRLNSLASRVGTSVTIVSWQAVNGLKSGEFVLGAKVDIFKSSGNVTTFVGAATNEMRRVFPGIPTPVINPTVKNRIKDAKTYTAIREVILRDLIKPELDRRNP